MKRMVMAVALVLAAGCGGSDATPHPDTLKPSARTAVTWNLSAPRDTPGTVCPGAAKVTDLGSGGISCVWSCGDYTIQYDDDGYTQGDRVVGAIVVLRFWWSPTRGWDWFSEEVATPGLCTS